MLLVLVSAQRSQSIHLLNTSSMPKTEERISFLLALSSTHSLVDMVFFTHPFFTCQVWCTCCICNLSRLQKSFDTDYSFERSIVQTVHEGKTFFKHRSACSGPGPSPPPDFSGDLSGLLPEASYLVQVLCLLGIYIFVCTVVSRHLMNFLPFTCI